MLKKIVLVLSVGMYFSFFSCVAPSPLVGKWSDNYNDVSLTADMTCVFSLTDIVTGKVTRLEGTYAISSNVLIFTLDQGNTILSEWDIRGSMLYLYWPTPDDNTNPIKILTLYRIGS
ncbi:MAG: hypothetical protein ACRC5H_07145 [Treponemataceae bacterium]